MFRIGWKMSSVPEGWSSPTEGKSELWYGTAREAEEVIRDEYDITLGPRAEYWVEDENGEVISRPVPVQLYECASSPVQAVVEFHEAFGIAIDEPRMGEDAVVLLDLRARLLAEEFDEVMEAIQDLRSLLAYRDSQADVRPYWAALLKELSDLRYVTYGCGIAFGLPLDTAFNRVHQSNMSKLVDGKPLMRADGKVLKGPGYKPADLLDLIY